MSITTHVSTLDNSIHKTIALLADIEKQFSWEEKRNESYAILRSTLRALRDRLPVESAVHFAAQLPLLVQGIYFERWRPATTPNNSFSYRFWRTR